MRLGKNIDRYCGETIDIEQTLRDIESATQAHGWTSEIFFEAGELKLFALRRQPSKPSESSSLYRVYISTGIHGDEPAGPLAMLRLLRENKWPADADLWICPCLNPLGFKLNSRENAKGLDLNREYLKPVAAEITAHIAWLERQPKFDLCVLLHEDWESQGFYLYEQNPDHQWSRAEDIISAVSKACPIDRSEVIEGRESHGGIVRPNLDPATRPQWPEAFFLITHKTRLSYTLEAPSDFPMSMRVDALVTAVRTAVEFP